MDEEILKKMIGQMIMVGFRGTNISGNDEIIRDFYDLNIGGTILFDYDVTTKSNERNIKDQEQLKILTHDLQRVSLTPLFVAVDQEGGNIARLKPTHGYEKTLSHAELGEKNDLDITRSVARLIASQVSNSGFNINLAPVVDLNINKENPIIGKLGRSISEDQEIVSRHASIFIEEHSRQNILTCIKHFMGHGSSKNDSHLGFVDVTESYDEREKLPFLSLIKKGMVDMVMTAHLFNRNYDNNHPFTLSRQVVTEILRKGFGFRGVIISDDIQMKAIADNYDLETAVLLAVKAGIDIILISNNVHYDPDAHIKAINTIFNAVNDGGLGLKRIKESFDRIIRLKHKIKLMALRNLYMTT